MFLRRCKDKQFFVWKQHFDRRYVCNPTVYKCGNLIFTNCMGYDKLPFHERDVCMFLRLYCLFPILRLVSRTVCVTTNCRFMSETFVCSSVCTASFPSIACFLDGQMRKYTGKSPPGFSLRKVVR